MNILIFNHDLLFPANRTINFRWIHDFVMQCPQMSQQITFHIKTFVAIFARVGSLAGVGAFMYQHGSMRGELFTANRACFQVRVRCLFSDFRGAIRCWTAALVRLAQFLLGVYVLDVVDPFGRRGEVFLAEVALERGEGRVVVFLQIIKVLTVNCYFH